MAARGSIKARLDRLRQETARCGREGVSGPALTRGTETAIRFFLGAVLAGAVLLDGRAPFGVALVAASGSGLYAGAALVGTALGYLALLPFSQGVRYLSAAVLTFAVAFAFYDIKVMRRPWVRAGVAAAMTAVTGGIYLSQSGWRPEETICLMSETALCLLAGRWFAAVLEQEPGGAARQEETAVRQAGSVLLLCGVLLSLSGVVLVADVSLGRALGAAAVLTAAWRGGVAPGAVLGVAVGLTLDLGRGGTPVYAMAYGCAGLAAGALRGKRLPTAAAFVVADAGTVLWLWDQGLPMAILYEVFVGSIAFLALPQGALRRLGASVLPEPGQEGDQTARLLVQKRLEASAQAFRTLFETLRSSFRAPENDNDTAVIFDRAACRVCCRCVRRGECWERDYVTTFNALNDATAPMLERGRGEAGDFPGYFADRCLHFSDFLSAVNQELTALLCRRQYKSRVRESRMAVCRQYGELSSLLEEAAQELSRELTPELPLTRALRRCLLSRGLEPETAVFRDGRGRLQVRLRGRGCGAALEEDCLTQMGQALGVPLRGERTPEGVSLCQQEPLMAVAGIAARKRDGETVSGDAGTYFKREDGVLYVLLCDGMGSGDLAHRESSLAVRLLEQFLQAGVDTQHALITLNSALALRGEEEGGFTTVDLLELDLYTGEAEVFKLGAAPTYVKKGTTVRRIIGSSLPAGVSSGQQATPDRAKLRLEPGDCVLMVSDGVAGTEDDGWVRRRLEEFDGASPKELVRGLVADGPAPEATDDRTALAVVLRPRE